jgi:hypothetical protein
MRGDMGIPIIRMEIEHMRQSIVMALTEYAARMDADIKAAVEEYCTPENLRNVISVAARNTLDAVIKEEVSNFFRYGEGRKHIAEVIREKLINRETYTTLDTTLD